MYFLYKNFRLYILLHEDKLLNLLDGQIWISLIQNNFLVVLTKIFW